MKSFSSLRIIGIDMLAGTNLCALVSSKGQLYHWPWLEESDSALCSVITDQDIERISCGDEYWYDY